MEAARAALRPCCETIRRDYVRTVEPTLGFVYFVPPAHKPPCDAHTALRHARGPPARKSARFSFLKDRRAVFLSLRQARSRFLQHTRLPSGTVFKKRNQTHLEKKDTRLSRASQVHSARDSAARDALAKSLVALPRAGARRRSSRSILDLATLPARCRHSQERTQGRRLPTLPSPSTLSASDKARRTPSLKSEPIRHSPRTRA